MRANMKRLLLAILVVSAHGALACDSTDLADIEVVDGNVDVRDVEFAPELEVDLTQMTAHESGLYYEDLVEGDGLVAEQFFVLAVDYRLWLADGTLLEDTRGRDPPFSFQIGINLVIAGWDAGLLGVKPGGRRKLVIPPQLAYGPVGFGPIPSQATLVFEVDVLSVLDP